MKIKPVAVIFLIIILSFCLRAAGIARYASFDIGYVPDSVRDAFIIMEMKAAFIGKFIYWKPHVAGWQFLGPQIMGSSVCLPPLFYYIIFPMAFFGANPVFQAIPNAVFSWLTTPVFMVLIYKLLDNIERRRRYLLAALGGLWQALFFTDVFFNSFTWNPGPIPFFFMIFALLYKLQSDTRHPMPAQILCWAIYGALLAVLMSLHSVTLLIMPVVFIASCVFFVRKNWHDTRRRLLPLASFFTAAAALFPYYYLEASRGWHNTGGILKTLIGSSAGSAGLNPFVKIISDYTGLAKDAYFLAQDSAASVISAAFLAVATFVGIVKFKGDRTLFGFSICTFALYCFAASNFKGPDHIHYKFLILFFPMLFALSALAYCDYPAPWRGLVRGFLIFGVLLSLTANIKYDFRHLYYRYGPERLMTSGDMIDILGRIPEGAVICTPGYTYASRRMYHPFKYIDKYILKKNLALKNFDSAKSEECRPGEYVVYPKYRFEFISFSPLKPAFRVLKTEDIATQHLHLIYESPSAYLYVREGA